MCSILSIGVASLGATFQPAHAALVFSGSYEENFDSLGPAGTTLPSGWSAARIDGSGTIGSELSLRVTAGTATRGGIYNTGVAGDPDRALGSLASGSTVPAYGLQLINTTGSIIDGLLLGGTMEQWRSGSSATVAESVLFEYSLNAVSLADPNAHWTSFPSLNLEEKLITSTSAGAVDGNLPANQWSLNGELAGLSWSDNDTLTLRWSDTDDTSSDGLYALDNFLIQSSVTPVPEPASAGTFILGLGGLALFHRISSRRRSTRA
jgi:hypothetical protein